MRPLTRALPACGKWAAPSSAEGKPRSGHHRAASPRGGVGSAAAGTVVRPVLTILRTAKRPMTLREISLAGIQARGLDAADTRVLRNVSQQVKMALANQRRQGVVAHACPRGRPVVWRIEDILPS